MPFETKAFQDHDGNELQLEKMGPPFSSLTPVSSRSKNNQQLTVFFSFNRTVWFLLYSLKYDKGRLRESTLIGVVSDIERLILGPQKSQFFLHVMLRNYEIMYIARDLLKA